MNYTFLLPVSYDAHYEKRILNIENEGVNIQILGFERNHYPGSFEDYKVEILGKVEHGKYINRIPTFIASIFKVVKRTKKADTIYCFNIETLLIGWFSKLFSKKRTSLVYDVADIREILIQDKLFSKVLRIFEKFLVKRTKVTVVTAPAYISGYFNNYLKLDESHFFVIENKVDSNTLPSKRQTNNSIITKNNSIKIGYFGVIRCRHSIQLLKKLIQQSDGRFELYLRGFFPEHLDLNQQSLLNLDNVYYGGTFSSPEDLGVIYSKVDLSWTAIHHYKPNIMWSRTNRFYQACYFQKPLIVQKGTYDAKVTENYGIGISIDLMNIQNSVNTLLSLTQDQIDQMNLNLKKLPEEIYTLTDEHQKLVQRLKT